MSLQKLIELCDRFFVNPMVQPYAGANRECMFCGTIEGRNGSTHHSYVDCPVIQYQEIKNEIASKIESKAYGDKCTVCRGKGEVPSPDGFAVCRACFPRRSL